MQVSKERSKTTGITCGVPQGTNLGPALFNLMLYDMTFLKLQSEVIKYTNDAVFAAICKKNENVASFMEQDICEIVEYLESNGMRVNFFKRCYINVNVKNDESLRIVMQQKDIQKVTEFKYLGRIIDDKGDSPEVLYPKAFFLSIFSA